MCKQYEKVRVGSGIERINEAMHSSKICNWATYLWMGKTAITRYHGHWGVSARGVSEDREGFPKIKPNNTTYDDVPFGIENLSAEALSIQSAGSKR